MLFTIGRVGATICKVTFEQPVNHDDGLEASWH
jgi:hypothetical protein